MALVPTIDAVARLGRLHPDEVFQAYEPALRLAFGYGVSAWEWSVGLRNDVVPGLFAALLKAAHLVGVDDPWARRCVLAAPQCALTVAMLVSVFRFVERRLGARAATWSLPLVLSWLPWVWFGGRPMSESLSAALLVCALERLDADDATLGRRGAFGAGLFLGFAEVTRYGSAAVIAPALVVLAVGRRWVTLRLVCLGGALVALALGALDRVTWGVALEHPHLGGWWHSLIEYLRFNVFTGGSSKFGRAPPQWYVGRLWAAPVVVLALGRWRRAEALLRSVIFVVPALVYFVAISVTEHKESRFLYPALLLLLVAALPFAVDWLARARGPQRVALGAAWAAASVALALVATPFDVEQRDLVWATVHAGRDARTTGLVILNEGPWGTGGSFFIGRDLPWCAANEPDEPCFTQAVENSAINSALYVVDSENSERDAHVMRRLTDAGFHPVERVGRVLRLERP